MSEWKEYKLGEIAEIVSEKVHISNATFDNYISTENMNNYFGGIEIAKTLPIAASVNRFSKNDILFSNIRTYFKKIWLSKFNGTASPDVLVFRAKGIKCVSKFLYYLLCLPEFTEYSVLTSKGAKMPRGDKDALLNYNFKLPSLPTQTAIAEILSSLDDKIELNNKINQELENLAQTLFKHWFVDFEFPNENGEPYKSSGGEMVDSELGEIPKGWEVGTIKDEFNINMGQSPKGNTYNETGEGMIFFQGRSDFGFRFPSIRMYTNDPKKVAKKFETLISVRAPVGDINMAEQDCCIGRGLGSISHPSELFSYTHYKVLSIQEELKSYDNEGTVFGSINKETLGNIKIVIPPISLSNDFDDLVKHKDSLIYNFTNQNKQLNTLRDTLLPKLISGELEVSQT